MSSPSEIGGDKQTIEGSLTALHNRLKSYTNDQITIIEDIISTIESFYKTEKHTHEKMQSSLQKSFEHTQSMSYLGSSIIGASWTTGVKELIEHYSQREASYPLLKQVILENLKRIRNEKVDEHTKALLYDEEIVKEMIDIERRVTKAKRTYDDACERLRQYHLTAKEKESGIKRLHHKILPKNELEKFENAVVDTRNMYILHVQLMNYALKYYIEQFIVDLDKLLVCDIFSQIEQALDDLVYSEYKRLRETLQRAIHTAVEDGDEQKRRLLPKTFQNYPVILQADHSDQIVTDEKHVAQLASAYASATNDVCDADQQIQLALENSVLNANQNKDSRIDSTKIRLKRMEMRKHMGSFIIDKLETLVPAVKTTTTTARTSRWIGEIKQLIPSGKKETNANNTPVDSAAPVTANETNIATAPMPSTPTYPCLAVVLYDFEGANEQEISVRKDEKIFIESKPDYDGWLVAKARDRTGLVPEAYVQLLSANATPLLEQGALKNVTMGNTGDTVLQTNTSKNDEKVAPPPKSQIDDDAEYFSDD